MVEINSNENLKLSVIIPTCNRIDLLSKCLEALSPGQQTLSQQYYEVIVSDDGQESRLAKETVDSHYCWSKWIRGPQRGPAANRNNGAKYASAEWFVFIDDDCIPDSELLLAYCRSILGNPNVKVLEGRIYADRPRVTLSEESPINEYGGKLWSCNMAIERHTFQSLGGFDERFPYAAMEDVDLHYRIRNILKLEPMFIREASVCHPWREGRNWNKRLKHQQSELIYLSLHPEESTRINARHMLYCFARDIMKVTIPGVAKFKGRGFLHSLSQRAYQFYHAMVLLLKGYM